MERSDQQIKVDVVNQLDWNASVDASNIKVAVSGGEVTLTGTVDYFSVRRAAGDIASVIPGVRDISNKIKVSYPSAVKSPSDSEIRTNVNKLLLWDSTVFSFEIDVLVKDGEVTLEGSVDAFWKKKHAERLVSGVLGVKNVVNKLAVTPTDKYADRVIAKSITDALDRMDLVKASNIEVRVHDGVVTLAGEVPSWNAKKAVGNAAEFTAGVSSVNNLLRIVW